MFPHRFAPCNRGFERRDFRKELFLARAWTGSLVAAVFEMDFWRALACMVVGVLIAAAIVSLLCYGGYYAFKAAP
ncbi:MAG: hypothetical protein ACPL7M_02060, partial [Bryobacteraceae bacterium]